jgi:hypothetical protein
MFIGNVPHSPKEVDEIARLQGRALVLNHAWAEQDQVIIDVEVKTEDIGSIHGIDLSSSSVQHERLH